MHDFNTFQLCFLTLSQIVYLICAVMSAVSQSVQSSFGIFISMREQSNTDTESIANIGLQFVAQFRKNQIEHCIVSLKSVGNRAQSYIKDNFFIIDHLKGGMIADISGKSICIMQSNSVQLRLNQHLLLSGETTGLIVLSSKATCVFKNNILNTEIYPNFALKIEDEM